MAFIPVTKKNLPSSRTGSIELTRRWRGWDVRTKGCGQSTRYTDAMWRNAYARLQRTLPYLVRPRVLMLGLASGSGLAVLNRAYPGAHVSAVEYDPQMIALANTLKLWEPHPAPKIIEGDAAEVVHSLTDTFDLIVVDLFDGPQPSALCTQPAFLHELKRLLAPDGALLINVYKDRTYLEPAEHTFIQAVVWQYLNNSLGLFWSTPPQVMPPEAWPEFGAIAMPVEWCAREQVGANGTRWSLWPFTFEMHTGDSEPNVQAYSQGHLARNRIAIWKRVSRLDVPRGWHQTRAARPWRLDAIHELAQDKYVERWSKDAQRNLRHWQRQTAHYDIVQLTPDEYLAAYDGSLTRTKTGPELPATLRRQLALPGTREHIELWGVRNNTSGAIIAGEAILYSPTHKSSMRLCPFTYTEARGTDAMVGLIDHWFARSLARGIRILYFSYFWQPGELKEWQGFSSFKSHFITRYIAYPPLLWKFVPGKLF